MSNHQLLSFLLREHFVRVMYIRQQQQAKNLSFGMDTILSSTPPRGLTYHPFDTRLIQAKQGSLNYRRNRTVYTDEQLETLEQVFNSSMYLVGPERKALAAKLSLKEIQIKVWFQNRRIKYRKQKRCAMKCQRHEN